MKLDADWLHHPGTQAVFDLFQTNGHAAWFVGGCVRNGLLRVPVDDIDITTDALPERVQDLAEQAGLKCIPTGIDHGTVTLVANDRPHEVTTLRRDVSTDGRRATVAFTDRLDLDAARRDFTMNALYATEDGEVLDPVGRGVDDLQARRLRFIGTPEDRIREDYLRILRFFRFFAYFADSDAGFDPDGLAACAALADGIGSLSKERIGSELKKLLSARDPGQSVAAMAQTGVLMHALPGADPKLLPILLHVEGGSFDQDPIRRLAALGGQDVAEALRLSRLERDTLSILRTEMASTRGAAELAYRFGPKASWDVLLLRAALFETPMAPTAETEIALGAEAKFPLKASDLMPELSGPDLGKALRTKEAAWIASGFTLSKADLLVVDL